jgi:protein gp37
MATNSTIEWTDMTWNPVTGCTKVSQGCKNCYAERMAKRLHAMGVERYRDGFRVTLHHDLIAEPARWTKPRRVFVNSMSDLFHPEVPDDFILQVFESMTAHPRHQFQVLTKRSERLRELGQRLPWATNVWMGVSVESDAVLQRVEDLVNTPAKTRFLSCEPLLGPLTRLHLEGIHWVIVGGESGPRCRPMESGWVEEILDRCRTDDVPFFFKQWGGTRKKKTGRLLHGRTYDEFPETITA